MSAGKKRLNQPQQNKPSKTKRHPLRVLLDNFFHIALLILLWNLYGDAVGGYARAVGGNIVQHLQKEDVVRILGNDELPTIFNIPPAWSTMPGWVYAVGLVLLVVVGVLLLIGYLKATRAISDKFWDTLRQNVRVVIRSELRRQLRVLIRWVRFEVRRANRQASASEWPLRSGTELSEAIPDSPLDTGSIKAQIPRILDESNVFSPNAHLQIPDPVRKPKQIQIPDGTISPQNPEKVKHPGRDTRRG